MSDKPTENFVYLVGERSVTLRPFDRLPAGVFRKSRNANEMEQMFAVVEAGVLDEKDLEVVDEMPVVELGEMFDAWAKHSETSYPNA